MRRWFGHAHNEPGATLNLLNEGHNGRPHTATDDAHWNRVNEIITANHRIMQKLLSIQCGTPRERMQAITGEPRFRKICV